MSLSGGWAEGWAAAQQAVEAQHPENIDAAAHPHALHMPAHIFARSGDWQKSIDLNRRSAEAALEQWPHFLPPCSALVAAVQRILTLRARAAQIQQVRVGLFAVILRIAAS